MGRVLITGATGLIGNAIARRLAERGDEVVALVRDPARAAKVLPVEITLIQGDMLDASSLERAFSGVTHVYHAAGMPEQWQRDESVFDRINRQGTANVMAAALAAGVERVVYTSTMDIFAAPAGGTLVETNVDPHDKWTAYERSKQAAEREVAAAREKGLAVVTLNPGATYGPSPVQVGLNDFFIRLMRRKMPAIPPGGMAVAYVEGVAEAHLAAMERGRPGESYLVADTHVTNHALARAIAAAAGLDRLPPDAPAWALKTFTDLTVPLARRFGFTPLIAPGHLTYMLWNVAVDASKAQRELGFEPLPLETGVARTMAWLRTTDLV